ncbi:MAG TPA: ABC transporter substrate-binding protein [Longimicrobiaceae bacterium]|nr:ABC transporter substrate-binding protein [Longimicrobiaceae bacterium]
MRIVSMLSSATEIVYALGLDERLVGISHECDYPPEALRLPRVSRSRFDPTGLESAEIDREVRRCMQEYGSVYEVDVERLRALRPDLILTQAVCEVCAVPTGSVEQAVAALPDPPQVLSLDAHTLEEIFVTMQQVADAAGISPRGEAAVQRLRERVERVRERVSGVERPRVLALEWLDPPFAPGHWVPEMIGHAGGVNLLGTAGSPSLQTEWTRLVDLDPDRLLLLPCGYDLRQARADADHHRTRLEEIAGRAIRGGGAWIGHGAYFSRSGPRVVEGIETLAELLHPDLFPRAELAGRVEAWP